jgi:hypothetical protein
VGRKREGQGAGGEVAQTMYSHMNKYKNNKNVVSLLVTGF